MPANVSPVLGMPYIQPSQAQKHVTHNEALKMLDVLVHLVVSSRTTSSPPVDPPEGRRHIVPDNASGAWSGQADMLAIYQAGTWIFIDPLVGWQAYLKDEDTFVTFTSTGWQFSASQANYQNIDRLGVNTTANANNRLSVSSPETLLTHQGDDHRLKINKNASGDVASLLFQSGFTGVAEMGVVGTDDFSIRSNPGGGSWTTALRVIGATGVPEAPQGLDVSSALTGTGVVGTVSESGGSSTGAVIERGSNANGDYIRWADGTQICSGVEITGVDANVATNNVFRSNGVDWTFPAAFADLSKVVGGAVVTGSAAEASHWVSCRPLLTTAMRIGLWSSISRTGRSFQPFAIGTWY